MLDVSIVFSQTSKITQRDVLLSPFPDTLPPFHQISLFNHHPIYIHIYTYTIHVDIDICIHVGICSSSDSFTCWWTFRLRDQKDFAGLPEGMFGGFHHGAPPKAEWSGPFQRVSFLCKNFRSSRNFVSPRECRCFARTRGEWWAWERRGEVPLGWNTICINLGEDPLPFGKSHTFNRIFFPIEYFQPNFPPSLIRPFLLLLPRDEELQPSRSLNTRGIWWREFFEFPFPPPRINPLITSSSIYFHTFDRIES